MKMKFLVGIMFLLILTSITSASSLVGVGVTPSRLDLELVGGKTQEVELLVFNTGDYPFEIGLSAEGEIASFITFEPTKALIDPEQMPHSLPIKNGKMFKLKFTPPAGESRTYTGLISATVVNTREQGFSGSVGSAVYVSAHVSKPFYLKSIFGLITIQQLVLVLGIIPLVLSGFLVLKKVSSKKKKAKKR